VIPVCDDVAQITDEDSVVRKIEQARLLRPQRHFLFKVVTGLTEGPLDATANRTEPGDKQCK
jgi:hypothetical protein